MLLYAVLPIVRRKFLFTGDSFHQNFLQGEGIEGLNVQKPLKDTETGQSF